jgi:hypothetical protein
MHGYDIHGPSRTQQIPPDRGQGRPRPEHGGDRHLVIFIGIAITH